MNRQLKVNWLLKLAVAAVPVMGMASAASAQYRTNDDGHLLDASNRIGSGGYNTTPVNDKQRISVTGNQIANGNVTGGFEFHDQIPYRDPTEFRGNLAGQEFDRFVSRTNGVPQPYTARTYNVGPQPFYGESRGAAPPAGYVRQQAVGSYVPGSMKVQGGEDLRLGTPLGPPIVLLPKAGEFDLPGQLDPTAREVVYAASPLYGVHELTVNDNPLMMSQTNTYTPRRAGIDDAALEHMRDELRATILSDEAHREAMSGPLSVDKLTAGVQEKVGDDAQPTNPQQMGKPIESPNKGALPSGAVTPGTLGTPQPGTGQLSDSRLLPASQQSAQYAEMQKRLDQFYGRKPVVKDEGPKPGTEVKRLTPAVTEDETSPTKSTSRLPAGGTGEDVTPKVEDYAGKSKALVDEALNPKKPDKPGEKPAPLKVDSLAAGVEAKGLGELLKTAEESMKAGKFGSAIQQYDAAEQVAPNNPLVWVGHANAELGAGYYLRSEQHLRQAFSADPALLMAQYDLKGFFGEDRLQYLVTDLKKNLNDNPESAMPAFLLAYIAYNTGNERRAGAYLDLAEKRAGGKDEVLGKIREHWAIPKDESTTQPEINK